MATDKYEIQKSPAKAFVLSQGIDLCGDYLRLFSGELPGFDSEVTGFNSKIKFLN